MTKQLVNLVKIAKQKLDMQEKALLRNQMAIKRKRSEIDSINAQIAAIPMPTSGSFSAYQSQKDSIRAYIYQIEEIQIQIGNLYKEQEHITQQIRIAHLEHEKMLYLYNKAKDAVDEADLVLYVIDGSKELDENDREIMELIQGKKVITLLNKSDLEKQILTSEIEQKLNGPVISISAKEETGIDEFYDALKEMFFEGQLEFNDEIYITNMRHKTALMNAKESLEQVVISIENQMPEDFYSIDLMNAYEELGFIIGESLEEDLVNEIFREFCMGK